MALKILHETVHFGLLEV